MTEVRFFICTVTLYHDMFHMAFDILAPLSAQVGKQKFNWMPECQKGFRGIEAILIKDVYPNHNQPSHIYCDASDYQGSEVILSFKSKT